MPRPSLIFFGSDAIALPALEYLVSAESPVKVVGVFSQPDRPQGRGQKCQPNPVSAWALAHNLPLWRPEKLGQEAVDTLAQSKADIALVMAYGHLLKPALLDTPPLGFLNLHGSILPAYRGASPLVGVVMEGAAQTGVSLMRVAPALDAGPVCDTEKVTVDFKDTAETLRPKIAQACVPLLRRALPHILSGNAEFIEQEPRYVSYTRKIEKSDGALDFVMAAQVLSNRIRALSPWPGCTVEVNGVPLKIFDAFATVEKHGALPGTVLQSGETGLRIATGSGILNITELQRPGGKRLKAAQFLRGFPLHIGTVFPSVSMPPLVSHAPFPRKTPTVSFDK